MRRALPAAAAALLALAALAAPLSGCKEEALCKAGQTPVLLGHEEAFYPWEGVACVDTLTAKPGGSWSVDLKLSMDMGRLRQHPEVAEGLVIALVGEQVYDAAGTPTGLTAISVTPRFTASGVPLSYYEGTLPVRALGNRRGSPFEATAEVPAGPWTRGGTARFSGRLTARLPADLPAGHYRPHVGVFVKFAGAGTAVDLGHLPYQLGQILEADLNQATFAGRWAKQHGGLSADDNEFMHNPQVLPEVKVGAPRTPRIPWTVFHDVGAYGQAGLLPAEDAGRLGQINRVRYPTPLVLYPRTYQVTPGIPTLYPGAALATLFIGQGTVPDRVNHFLDLQAGEARASLRSPDGKTVDLGSRRFAGEGDRGPRLAGGGFSLDLSRTGDYVLRLTGHMNDRFGRRHEAGGSYPFTVAYPLSFSTPVKPGTNFIEGAAFPAAAHINPPVPAAVKVDLTYLPGADARRTVRRTFRGQAGRFGHYSPSEPPLRMEEAGEYRSLITARYTDAAGNLWHGAQASAGVVAQKEPKLRLHGGRTYLSPPDPRRPHHGGLARYRVPFEGASSYLGEELLSQFDNLFPYHSGDTLFVATTFPFESVVGIVLSMEARQKELARRLLRAWNPGGAKLNFPITPRRRTPVLLPDVFKISEDHFGYYRLSEEHPDHLPIISSNARGLSPFQFPAANDIEAYAYLSVIRPGFPVLSLAFSGSFMGPCWIVSPNPYGGQINASPNGDLPGDLYRVMAGLVVRDLRSGDTHVDAYSASIVALPPGGHDNSVSAPGERPQLRLNGRAFPYFMGMDTSDIMMVGSKMMLGGTVMPPVAADVKVTVKKPGGEQEVLQGRANRLGSFPPPRPVMVDRPGIYRVGVQISRGGKTGDVVGSGDGEFYHFAIPPDGRRFLRVGLPPVSRVEPSARVKVPLAWPAGLKNARVAWSVMMPGCVVDEGILEVSGAGHELAFSPEWAARQYPFVDRVDHATGKRLLADTFVVVIYVEGELGGQKVYDAARVILRGERLFNSQALTAPGKPAGHPGKGDHPGKGGHPGHIKLPSAHPPR